MFKTFVSLLSGDASYLKTLSIPRMTGRLGNKDLAVIYRRE